MIAGRFCYAFILGLPLCLFPARLRGFNRCRVYLYHRASKRRQKPTEAAQGGRRKQSIKGRGTATATLKPTGQPHQQPATGDTATAEKQDMRKSAKSLSATFCGFFFQSLSARSELSASMASRYFFCNSSGGVSSPNWLAGARVISFLSS